MEGETKGTKSVGPKLKHKNSRQKIFFYLFELGTEALESSIQDIYFTEIYSFSQPRAPHSSPCERINSDIDGGKSSPR